MSKHALLMQNIVCQFHPEFINNPYYCQLARANPQFFNVEHLVEHCLSAVGGYQYVDQAGYDFSDFSDSKTVSVNPRTYRAEIGSVETKIGALRITAYNPVKDQLDYFFVPKNDLERVRQACYGNHSHKQRIVFSYSRVDQDDYGWFEDYRIDTFETLALMPG